MLRRNKIGLAAHSIVMTTSPALSGGQVEEGLSIRRKDSSPLACANVRSVATGSTHITKDWVKTENGWIWRWITPLWMHHRNYWNGKWTSKYLCEIRGRWADGTWYYLLKSISWRSLWLRRKKFIGVDSCLSISEGGALEIFDKVLIGREDDQCLFWQIVKN